MPTGYFTKQAKMPVTGYKMKEGTKQIRE